MSRWKLIFSAECLRDFKTKNLGVRERIAESLHALACRGPVGKLKGNDKTENLAENCVETIPVAHVATGGFDEKQGASDEQFLHLVYFVGLDPATGTQCIFLGGVVNFQNVNRKTGEEAEYLKKNYGAAYLKECSLQRKKTCSDTITHTLGHFWN